MGKAEHYVEGYLVEKAKKLGYLCYKFNSDSETGVPDRILIARGQTIFIETKSKTGQPSPKQRVIHRRMAKQGVHVYVPHTREEIDEIFIKHHLIDDKEVNE